jgi:hypothetical protein
LIIVGSRKPGNSTPAGLRKLRNQTLRPKR